MKLLVVALGIAVTLLHYTEAAKSYEGRVSYGTVGLGFRMYDPPCAYMCRSSVSGWMLECPEDQYQVSAGHHRRQHTMMMPTAECYASNEPFLQTLAWCIHTHCSNNTAIAAIEAYWERNAPGNLLVQPLPNISYQDALASIESPPNEVINATEILDRVSLTDEWLYQANWGANVGIELNMSTNNQFTCANQSFPCIGAKC